MDSRGSCPPVIHSNANLGTAVKGFLTCKVPNQLTLRYRRYMDGPELNHLSPLKAAFSLTGRGGWNQRDLKHEKELHAPLLALKMEGTACKDRSQLEARRQHSSLMQFIQISLWNTGQGREVWRVNLFWKRKWNISSSQAKPDIYCWPLFTWGQLTFIGSDISITPSLEYHWLLPSWQMECFFYSHTFSCFFLYILVISSTFFPPQVYF